MVPPRGGARAHRGCDPAGAAELCARPGPATTWSPSRRSVRGTGSRRCCGRTSVGSVTRSTSGAGGDPRPASAVHGRREAPRGDLRRGRRQGHPDRPQPRGDLRPGGRPRRARARPPGDHRRQPVRRRPPLERRVADVRSRHRNAHQEHPPEIMAGSTSRSRSRRRRSTAAATASSRGRPASTPRPPPPTTSRCRGATSVCSTTPPCST